MSALETLATRWQHSIANSYFKRITYRPSKTHEEFRIVTPTKPENKGILLDQIFTMEWEKLRQAVRVTSFAQPVEQIDEPTWTAWTLQKGGVGGKPQPKTKKNVASWCRMETMIHLITSDELPVSGGLKMKLAPVWISQDWACRKVAECQVCDFILSKIAARRH